jgi:hypothetical protein
LVLVGFGFVEGFRIWDEWTSNRDDQRTQRLLDALSSLKNSNEKSTTTNNPAEHKEPNHPIEGKEARTEIVDSRGKNDQ